ncbi:type II toxin-antitoxin system HicB family antitoxin [Marichromatium gracile]|nr:type II toxin-antitoxin system HicB family antitoxin [Marichromatium gracile]
MKYPVKIEKTGESWLVSFPDFPEALTEDSSYEGALDMAWHCLLSTFDLYFEDLKEIPAPSAPEPGQVEIKLPVGLQAQIMLLNAFILSGISKAELARRMSTHKQEVQRILSIKRKTKIDRVEQALNALGFEFQLGMQTKARAN